MRGQVFQLFLVILLLAGCSQAIPKRGDLAPFPRPAESEVRNVIRLPAAGDESTLRVELIIGRETLVDCNRRWFGGKLEREIVSGAGQAVYRVTSVAGPATTMMACPDEETRQAFVTVRFANPFVAYSSKTPLVVYVPSGFVVRYRTWQGQGKLRDATIE